MVGKQVLKFRRFSELALLACLLFGFVAAPYMLARHKPNEESSGHSIPIAEPKDHKQPQSKQDNLKGAKNLETANFGAGCFWCVEAVFRELNGVHSVESGFMGGTVDNPTYEQVCTGKTGHAEICQISFDPQVIRFKELLEVFWKTHDPTTLNQQGADKGTQYRSAVFYTSEIQKNLAQEYKQKLNQSGAFDAPIVTEITPASSFYPAGEYHADYYRRNPNAGYCRAVIQPKLDKFRKAFSDKLKAK